MNSEKTRSVALSGIMIALMIVVFTLETVVGQMLITPPAVLSLSVFCVLCFSDGVATGFISGVVFGLSSLIIAVIVANPLFILPYISVLPRMLVGITAYGIFHVVRRLTENSENKFVKEVLPYSVGSLFAVILNTFLVLVCLTLFAPTGYGNTFTGWFKAVITLNFPIELVSAVILTPILSQPIRKMKGKK